MELLQQYFHLPIVEASKQLGICSTSLKKICRKHGLLRWPHRKVGDLSNHVARCNHKQSETMWIASKVKSVDLKVERGKIKAKVGRTQNSSS